MSISAAARSTGLSSVAVSQPIVLAGDAWQVQARPPAGHAAPQQFDGMTFFAPDAPGSWTLSSAHSSLKLQALTHDSTPFDCGRAECHASLSAHTASAPMSHALEHPLDAASDSAAVSCMLDCHVLGERGVSDGGFQAVAARLGFTWTEHTRWNDLPQTLRRLGGVRCTACHGPGAIPPPEQRGAILRSEVCASCHDAPPRYTYVSQWRSGRMASSDRDAAARQAPCARCHTTAGFLARAGVRKLTDDPAHAEATGIACAACHAPHAAERGPRLIREAMARVLDPQCPSLQPSNPHAELDSKHCANRRQERARYEIGVVLDDAAALFHNPDLSRALLSDAAQQLSDRDALEQRFFCSFELAAPVCGTRCGS